MLSYTYLRQALVEVYLFDTEMVNWSKELVKHCVKHSVISTLLISLSINLSVSQTSNQSASSMHSNGVTLTHFWEQKSKSRTINGQEEEMLFGRPQVSKKCPLTFHSSIHTVRDG